MKKLLPLFVALILNGAGHAYFSISIAGLGRLLDIADINVGLLLSLPAFLLMFTAPGWGIVCDKYGRKLVLMVGFLSSSIGLLGIAALLNVATMLSTAMIVVVLFSIRVLHAGLSAGLKPAMQATMCDVTTSNSRLKGMSFMGVAFGAGTIIGGAAAILTGTDSILIGLSLLGGLMFISSVWIAFQLPETHGSVDKRIAASLNWRAILPFLLTTVVAISAFSALQPISNWTLQDRYALSPDAATRFTGAVMMSSMLAMIITQLTFLRLTLSPYKIYCVGGTLSFLALAACCVAQSPALLFSATVFIGVGLGMLLPANLVLMTSGISDSQQGKVAGVNGFSQGLGLSIGPLFATLLYQIWSPLPYAVLALLFAGAGTLFIASKRQHVPC